MSLISATSKVLPPMIIKSSEWACLIASVIALSTFFIMLPLRPAFFAAGCMRSAGMPRGISDLPKY